MTTANNFVNTLRSLCDNRRAREHADQSTGCEKTQFQHVDIHREAGFVLDIARRLRHFCEPIYPVTCCRFSQRPSTSNGRMQQSVIRVLTVNRRW